MDILVKGKAAAKKLGEDDSSDSDSTTSLGVAGYADDGDVPVDEDDLDRNNISVRVWSQCDLDSIKLIHTQTVNDRALKHSSILSTHMLHITFNLLGLPIESKVHCRSMAADSCFSSTLSNISWL